MLNVLQGTGIWYVFPWEPVGPSNSWDFMARGEAMHTPLTKFHNNVAHSSAIVCIYVLYSMISLQYVIDDYVRIAFDKLEVNWNHSEAYSN